MMKFWLSISILLFFIFHISVFTIPSQEEKSAKKKEFGYSYTVPESKNDIRIKFDDTNEPRLIIRKIWKVGIEWYMMPDMWVLNYVLSRISWADFPTVEDKPKFEDKYLTRISKNLESFDESADRNVYSWKDYPLGELSVYVESRLKESKSGGKEIEYYISVIYIKKK